MFKFIKNMISLSEENRSENIYHMSSDSNEVNISPTLENNKTQLKTIFSNCSDLVFREIKIANNPRFTAMIVYIKNMIETVLLEETIVKRITSKQEETCFQPNSKDYLKYMLGVRDEDIYLDMSGTINGILSGDLALFIDGVNEGMILHIKNPPSRAVEEPQVETVVRGPREGFTESLATNLVLIRKRIKSPNLKTESFILGRETKTEVIITYLSHIANEKIVAELKERINKIDADSVLTTHFIKEYITDAPFSGFPAIFSTERPDVLITNILEGRIGLLVDGTPITLSLPAVFFEFLESNEDFYLPFIVANIYRWVRYLSFVLTLTLPGIYIAITEYHQELIPTSLLVTIVKARSGVPYPAILECIVMLFAYEILREAGTRMPRAVGQSMSIVGALVLGQSAIEAGLVSAPMLIVVSLTAISSYAIPFVDMTSAVILPRFILILLGGSFGLLGVVCGLIVLSLMLISMRSFGVPYMAPLAPYIKEHFTETVTRPPMWAVFNRPWFITWRKSTRRKPVSHFKSMKEGKYRK